MAACDVTHLNIDAFVCLTDAGDGRRRSLAGVGGGAGVVRRIQKALLWPSNVGQTAQQIGASSPAPSPAPSNVSVSVSVRLPPHQAQAQAQAHLRSVQGPGHMALLSDARVGVGESASRRVIHGGGGLFIPVREGIGGVFWKKFENK